MSARPSWHTRPTFSSLFPAALGTHVLSSSLPAAGDADHGMHDSIRTFEELFEVITWVQLGIHNKPIGTPRLCTQDRSPMMD